MKYLVLLVVAIASAFEVQDVSELEVGGGALNPLSAEYGIDKDLEHPEEYVK